jgi:uncharacterized protein involved in outer membrane biogenesis
LIAFVVIVALTAGTWQVLERLLEVDQYRPLVEQEIARFTGLPVRVGGLDLAWRPVPSLSALDVSIGGGDLHLEIARIDVVPRLRDLLSRRIVIGRIRLGAASLRIPNTSEGIDAAWTELIARLDAASGADDEPAGSGLVESVAVRRVIADDAVVRLGAGTSHPIALSIEASGLDEDAFHLDLEAEIESLGATAVARFEIPLAGTNDPNRGTRGEFDARGLRPQRGYLY